jgi:hypothetical protein
MALTKVAGKNPFILQSLLHKLDICVDANKQKIHPIAMEAIINKSPLIWRYWAIIFTSEEQK